MLPLRFVPYHQLDGQPNVIVDGSAVPSTRLTLSHWPGSPTPVEVRDDLSAQIALHAIAHRDWFEGIEVVSNNHFDQDGLTAAHALVDPVHAAAHAALLIDIARAGDFATFHDRTAARLAMAVAALADEARSPLDAATFAGSYSDQCGRLYEVLLPRLPEMLRGPDGLRDLWGDEDAHLAASIGTIVDGSVRIEELPEIDLAIVTVPERLRPAGAHRFAHSFAATWSEAVHPMAINNATAMLRVLLVRGRRYRLELRYETWVMLTSRHVMPRPDLRPLAAHLSDLEPDGTTWTADGPGSLTPFLRLDGDAESGLAPDVVRAELTGFFACAAPAWDPFAPS